MDVLYRVRVGEDEYVGRAEEVVRFMARAEGAPGTTTDTYMEGVARRLAEKLGIEGVDTSSPEAFLDALDEHQVVPIATYAEPSDDRVDPAEALGDDPVSLGEGVEPDDLDL
jgi:hypothetical protein